jgi:hypothetical protein
LRTRLTARKLGIDGREPTACQDSGTRSAGIFAAAGAGDEAESDWDRELLER